MKKLIFILIVLASCKSDSERNLLMTTLINNQKSLNDKKGWDLQHVGNFCNFSTLPVFVNVCYDC